VFIIIIIIIVIVIVIVIVIIIIVIIIITKPITFNLVTLPQGSQLGVPGTAPGRLAGKKAEACEEAVMGTPWS
jgi:amino acid transporter